MPNRLKTPTLLLFLLIPACLNTFGQAPAKSGCEAGVYRSDIERYTKAIKFSKNDYYAYIGRGTAYLGLGDHDSALRDFNRAIELVPQNDDAYLERGKLFKERSNTERAVSDFTRTIELNPFNSAAYYERARSRWNGNIDLVISDLSKAIELSPNDPLFLGVRGVALRKGGMKLQAMPDLNKAFEMITNEIDRGEKTLCEGNPYIQRGYIAGGLQRVPDALKDFDTAVRIDPGNSEAYSYRANILVFQRKYHEALADLNKAIGLKPNYAELYLERAGVYEKLNWPNTAAADRQRYQMLRTSIPSN